MLSGFFNTFFKMLDSILNNLPEIISSITAGIALWFTYNQYTKNKMTDYKLEKLKEEDKKQQVVNAGNIATIFGELWELLYFLKADRVYIIQPHPLYNQMYISATLEVKNYGVSSAKNTLTNVKIETLPKFVARLAKEDLIYIEDTETADVETKVKSIMVSNGCKSIFIKRLVDENNNWIGNIVLGYLRPFKEYGVERKLIERMTRTSAMSIQYILPELKSE